MYRSGILPVVPDVLMAHLRNQGKVWIPEELIQLRGKRLLRLAKGDKKPIDTGWTKDSNIHFDADDKPLMEHLLEGNNYGVRTGYGLIVIDADNPEIFKVVEKRLPKTFTVQSPGHKGHHYYYRCGLENKLLLEVKVGSSKIDFGEIQSNGQQVVGPNSIHPNGQRYAVIDESSIAEITTDQLLDTFKEYLNIEDQVKKTEEYTLVENQTIQNRIKITDVIDVSLLNTQGQEFYGVHPIHGSDTGHNFWVNPEKNVWHCFRCASGGGPLSWLAVESGLIDCEQAQKGALREDLYWKAIDVAVERGLIEKEQVLPRGEAARFFDGKRFIPKRLGDYLMQRHKFATLRDTKEIYVYKDGEYMLIGEEIIKHDATQLLGEEFRSYRAEEAMKYIQNLTFRPREDTPIHLLPLRNGVLNLETEKLEPYREKWFFTFKIPVDYKPDLKC